MERTKWGRFALTVCACCVLGAILVSVGGSPEALAERLPSSPVPAICAVLALYTIKSETIVFPLNIIEMTAGFLFPTVQAIVVNIAGIALCMTIPFFAGRKVGVTEVAKLTKKYPKFEAIVDFQQDNSLFLCFFMRLLGGFPGDIVTMYFGATGTPYWKNLLGGVLGAVPHMLVAIFFGASIQTPGSPEFWLSAALVVLIGALAVGLYFLYSRHRNKGKL